MYLTYYRRSADSKEDEKQMIVITCDAIMHGAPEGAGLVQVSKTKTEKIQIYG